MAFLADPWPQLRCPSPLPTVISCDETEEQSQHSQEAPHDDDNNNNNNNNNNNAEETLPTTEREGNRIGQVPAPRPRPLLYYKGAFTNIALVDFL